MYDQLTAQVVSEIRDLKEKLAAVTRERDEALRGKKILRDYVNQHPDALAAQCDALRAEVERLRGALLAAQGLTVVARMPNAEHVADAHNDAVRTLRDALRETLQEPTPSTPSKEWCANMATLEGDSEIGAGPLAMLPQEPTP